MFEGYIPVCGQKIPRKLLGTSPFIAAGQFGHRARLYQLDLYNQPKNILKIIRKSYQLGVTGIQVIPYPPVVEAIKWAGDEGCKLEIVGTVRPDRVQEDIKLLSEMESGAMLLHAMITDRCEWDSMVKHLKSIEEENAVPGLVTHTPFRTTRKLIDSPVHDFFHLYMVPLNKIGYLMDTDVFMEQERAEFRYLIKKLDKRVIAKKTLAAGIIAPDDAFNFIKTLDYADAITVGIASEAEAVETFGLLK